MSFRTAKQMVLLTVYLMTFANCGSTTVAPEWPPSLSGVVEKAPTVSFCELVKHPELYQNKVIRTQAIFHGDRENEMLYDSRCPDKDTFTWVEFDPSYAYTDEAVKRGLAEALRPKPPYMDSKARVTVVGRFDGPNANGYGHLNGYRFRFLIMRVEQVDPVAALMPRP